MEILGSPHGTFNIVRSECLAQSDISYNPVINFPYKITYTEVGNNYVGMQCLGRIAYLLGSKNQVN